MVPNEIKEWEAGGEYISFGPLKHKVFVKQLGSPDAPAEKTLLLVHGFPESSFSYHRIVDGMLKIFERIILLDMPGYGWSDKPVEEYTYSLLEQADSVFAAWNHFGVTGGHLLGHDMGVSVSTEILTRHEQDLMPAWFSDGLQSLTLTNGSLVLGFAKLRITQKILLTRIGRTFNKLTTFKLFRQQVLSAHGNRNLSDQEIQWLWDANTLQMGHRKVYLTIGYLRDRKRFEKTRWLPSLSKTKLPVHLCWGDDDRVAVIAMPRYVKEKVCPQATLTEMKGVGHFGQLSSPDKWVASVSAWYEKTFGL